MVLNKAVVILFFGIILLIVVLGTIAIVLAVTLPNHGILSLDYDITGTWALTYTCDGIFPEGPGYATYRIPYSGPGAGEFYWTRDSTGKYLAGDALGTKFEGTVLKPTTMLVKSCQNNANVWQEFFQVTIGEDATGLYIE